MLLNYIHKSIDTPLLFFAAWSLGAIYIGLVIEDIGGNVHYGMTLDMRRIWLNSYCTKLCKEIAPLPQLYGSLLLNNYNFLALKQPHHISSSEIHVATHGCSDWELVKPAMFPSFLHPALFILDYFTKIIHFHLYDDLLF